MVAAYEKYASDAMKVSEQSGVPASVILAQLILESSGKYENGLSYLAATFNNLFGVKGSGSAGSITLPTTEYINGQFMTVNADFRAYNTPYESLLDHSKVLSLPRYKQYTSSAKTVNEYIDGIAKGGYATDQNYASKLKNIVSQYNLTKYDTGIATGGYTLENTHDPITNSGSGSGAISGASTMDATSSDERKFNLIEGLYFNTIRILAIGGLIVIMLLFFIKAFPVVEDAAAAAIPQAKAVKKLKKVGVKK